jgi:hypothetical protein
MFNVAFHSGTAVRRQLSSAHLCTSCLYYTYGKRSAILPHHEPTDSPHAEGKSEAVCRRWYTVDTTAACVYSRWRTVFLNSRSVCLKAAVIIADRLAIVISLRSIFKL